VDKNLAIQPIRVYLNNPSTEVGKSRRLDLGDALISHPFSPEGWWTSDAIDNTSFDLTPQLVAVWDRMLSSDEVKSLAENPWQIFGEASFQNE